MAVIRRVAALRAIAEVLRGSRRPGAPSLSARVKALPRMISQGLTGQYPHLAKGRLALAALALAYLVSPVDAVPELLVPLLGLGDDALVAAWLAGALLSEADTFLTWERSRPEVVLGEAIPR